MIWLSTTNDLKANLSTTEDWRVSISGESP